MKKFKVKKFNIYLAYTLIFCVLSLIVFSSFIINGKSFIWDSDGYKQHFIIFEAFNKSIRNILSGISTFSWNSGLGLDVIGQYSYYILGDPFAYIGLLFPMDSLEIAYIALIIFRIYCIGLSFVAFSKHRKQHNLGTIVGALMYTFCGFVLFASLRHPYFSNPLILLPLLLIGIDKILEKDKYKFFIFIVAISCISSYYFCYMLTFIGFIYALTRYISEYKSNGKKFFLLKFAKTFGAYIIGILISGIIIVPTIYAFINSARGGASFTYYGLGYYAKLILMDISTPFWSKIYVSSIFIFMLPIALRLRKKNTENKTILLNLLIHFIILLVPILGSVMNGFSFQQNRWAFGFAFFACYLVTNNLRSNLKYSIEGELEKGLVFVILYDLFALLLTNSTTVFALSSSAFAFIVFVILLLRNWSKFANKSATIFKILTLLAVMGNIAWFSWYLFVHTDYLSEFLNYGQANQNYSTLYGKTNNFDEAIEYIKNSDNSFYRIGTNKYETSNLSLKYDYNSLNSYLSIGNKYVSNLAHELSILGITKTDYLRELDSRTKITSLLSTKYYVVSKNDASYVPYGYTLIKKFGKANKSTQIYENEYYLPIGVFYNNYTLKNDYDNLDYFSKESALLKTAVVENTEDLSNYNIKSDSSILENSSKEIKYEIVDENEIIKSQKIHIEDENNSFEIKFDEIKNCELYLYFENLNYSSKGEYYITANYKNIEKEQRVRNKVTDAYYEPTPNILINLGYAEKHSGTIAVGFTANGNYTFDNIKLIAVPMDNYANDIENLKKYEFTVTDYTENSINGTIANEEDGILQISTSYSNGWTAYVDGVKTDILNVNTGFIGIPLSAGEHEISFVYSTPYLNVGIVLSIIGIIAFAVICIKKK